MNILNCKINVPRKNSWKGHPFYFELVKSFEKIISQLPKSYENLISIPIWFNRHLKTKFDVDISRAGFNFLKDLYPNGQLENFIQNRHGLLPSKLRKLGKIVGNMPEEWSNCIANTAVRHTVVLPCPVVNYCETDYPVQLLGTDRMYKILISNIVKVPTGVTRWRLDIVLSDRQLKTSLTFARVCSSSVFNHVFQYKIVTQILPTRKYSHRYLIEDSDLCSRCSECADTVYHSSVVVLVCT